MNLAATAAILAAVWLTMLVGGRGELDFALFAHLYAGREPLLVATARAITLLGEPSALIAASLIIALGLWALGLARAGFTLLIVTMLAPGLSEIQKNVIARPRPELEPHLVLVKSQSFPSGHSVSSMVFYLTLVLIFTRHSRWRHPAAAAAILVSILVGMSRVMLGVHWPSDVVGGWAFGLLWVIFALPATERLIEPARRS